MGVINNVFNGGRLVLRVGGTPGGTRDPIMKPDFSASPVGWWAGMIVRIPALPADVIYAMLVRQTTISGDGGFTSSGDSAFQWCGHTGTPIRTPQVRMGMGSGNPLMPSNTESDARLSTLTEAPAINTAYLVTFGLTNRGSAGSPNWHWFMAMCPLSGVAPTGYARTWVIGSTLAGAAVSLPWFDELFVCGASSARRTPIDTTFEHLFVIRGEAPWDTANNRFSQSVLQDMATGTFNCQSSAVLNGGTLLHWWKLRNMTLGQRTCTVTGRIWASESYNGTDFIVDGAVLGQNNWLDAENIVLHNVWRNKEVWGGRGTVPVPFSGTYQGGTGIERRWVQAASGAPLAGALGTWTSVGTFGGGNFAHTTDVLPWSGAGCTEYELQLRQVGGSATASKRGLWVGTHILNTGQSGTELLWNEPNNFLNITAPAGCVGELIDYVKNTQAAGSLTNYVQPTLQQWFVEGAVTPPNVHHGFLLFLRNWHARGQGPVQINSMAYAGIGPDDFVDAGRPPSQGGVPGQGGWTMRGQIYGNAPATGPLDASGVGFSSMLAFNARRQCDLALMMWVPGLNVDETPTRGNRFSDMCDEMYNVSPGFPWLVFPTWRNGRPPNDIAGAIAHRNTHIIWALDQPGRRYLVPYFPDFVMEATGTGHPAGGANNNGPGHPTHPSVLDNNIVGAGRQGLTLGALCAEWFMQSPGNPRKLWGPRLARAHFTDGGRTAIDVEVGRRVNTLNGAAPLAEVFFVSTDNGVTWTRLSSADTTVSIVGTKVRLTRTSGSWPASNVRVSMYREHPWHWQFSPEAGGGPPSQGEWAFERYADGLLYDMQRNERGGMTGAEAGWPLSLLQLNGVPVAARDNIRRVLAIQRLPAGSYTLQARVYGPNRPPEGLLVTVVNAAVVI